MFTRFTDRARKAMQLAEGEARRLKHPSINPGHIVLGMLAEGDGVAGAVLKSAGLTLERARLKLSSLESFRNRSCLLSGELPLTEGARLVIEQSADECRKLQHNYPGTEHLLLSLCREENAAATRVLFAIGTNPDEIRHEVLSILGHAE